MHRRAEEPARDEPGRQPFEVVRHLAVEGGVYKGHGAGFGLDAAGLGYYGDVEPERRLLADERVHPLDVEPEEVVEVLVAHGGVLVAVPPEPVAPLGGVEGLPGLRKGLFGRRPLALLLERFFVLHERLSRAAYVVPGGVVLAVAYPYLEVVAYPRAGEYPLQPLTVGGGAEELAYGHALQERVARELGVERVEEVPPVVFVGLPGVLAVEYYGDHVAGGVVHEAVDVGKPRHQVARCGVGVHPRVVEAYEVREDVVAEYERDVAPARVYRVGPVEEGVVAVARVVPPERSSERVGEYLLVGGEPVYAGLGHEAEHIHGDRALGGPHALWPAAEGPGVELHGLPYLRRGVLGVREPLLRKLHVGHRLPRRLAVAEEREDGMVVG